MAASSQRLTDSAKSPSPLLKLLVLLIFESLADGAQRLHRTQFKLVVPEPGSVSACMASAQG